MIERPRPVAPRSAGLAGYLKEAFLFRWNLLSFLGLTAAAALSPIPGALIPLALAAELSYLAGLVSIPRFRRAVDARHHERRTRSASSDAVQPVERLLEELPGEDRSRFESLRRRCLEMRSIAEGVSGRTGDASSGEEIRTPALNRLLWVFLRLLVSRHALSRFLSTTDPAEIRSRLEQLRRSLAEKDKTADDRTRHTLEDSISVGEMRLQNFEKARRDSEFLGIELERIEAKIHALTELSVSRQDPDALSAQVDSVTESMRQTEKAIGELNLITGLTDELEEAPAILSSDLDGRERNEA